MSVGKTVGVVSLAAAVSLGIGFAVGSSMNKGISGKLDGNNNSAPIISGLKDKNLDELGVQLSDIMLPKDEYDKLGGAILQSAMGLFMAQAQGAGISVDEKATEELKKKIDDKYTRKYFTDINAVSMKELSKEDLISILSFYATDAGQKFLKLSPEIIQKTMNTVQTDLSQWLPVAVNEVVAKLKNGGKEPNAVPSGSAPSGSEGPGGPAGAPAADEKPASNS